MEPFCFNEEEWKQNSSSTERLTSLEDLPEDTLISVVYELGLSDLRNVSLVCSKFRIISSVGIVWKHLCATEMNFTFLHHKEQFEPMLPWKDIFKNLWVQKIGPTYHDKQNKILGCSHYKRNCQIRASCCNKIYPCRICHDENSDHFMNRFETSTMLCMKCLCFQPTGQFCANPTCKSEMSSYYCDTCNLWTDKDKPVYHCDKCGICRIGQGIGVDNFHCDTCGLCLSLKAQSTHVCYIKDGLRSHCVICKKQELLFYSRDQIMLMKCGHGLHFSCFLSLGQREKCTVCLEPKQRKTLPPVQLSTSLEVQERSESNRSNLVLSNQIFNPNSNPQDWQVPSQERFEHQLLKSDCNKMIPPQQIQHNPSTCISKSKINYHLSSCQSLYETAPPHSAHSYVGAYSSLKNTSFFDQKASLHTFQDMRSSEKSDPKLSRRLIEPEQSKQLQPIQAPVNQSLPSQSFKFSFKSN